MVAREEEIGELGEKGEGIKKYTLVVQNSPRDVKDSTGVILSNIVTTIYGARWVLEILGKHFVKYMIV